MNQAKLQAGETLVVIGCGGVGLSAVMIGHALGARVVAVDISQDALDAATDAGAEITLNSRSLTDDEVVTQLFELTDGGAQVSLEALGRENTVDIAIRSLATRGRHVQIGLLSHDPRMPLGRVIAQELAILGSHGMPASAYPELLALVESGRLHPERLISRRISLEQAPAALAEMSAATPTAGVTLIEIAPF